MDFHEYNYSPFENMALIDGMHSISVNLFREVLEEWDGYQKYIPKIDKYMKQIGDIGRKCYLPNKPNCGYNVLNHGDFHPRNTLIKLDSDKRLEKFCFVSRRCFQRFGQRL